MFRSETTPQIYNIFRCSIALARNQSTTSTWKSSNFEQWYYPLNMQTGHNKKTSVSYPSVLQNTSRTQSNRRRAPTILMNFGGLFHPLNQAWELSERGGRFSEETPPFSRRASWPPRRPRCLERLRPVPYKPRVAPWQNKNTSTMCLPSKS